MVIADFLQAVQAMTDLLLKFSRHPFGISSFAVVNVTEELIDGLTMMMIEIKAIREAVWAASGQAKRRIVSSTVNYQGQVVS